MVRSVNTPFNIELLEGSQAGTIIPLTGRSAPYNAGSGGSISFGGTQRSKLVWHQGNPVATHLIFGPTIDPTSVNGIWKERYLGEDAPIDLVETFESVRDRGLMLRVSWSTIERVGILKQFEWRPGVPTGGLSDIGWSMTFEWSRSGNDAGRLFVPTVGQTTKPFRTGLTAVANDFANSRTTVNIIISEIGNFAGLNRATSAALVANMEATLRAGDAVLTLLTDTASRLGGVINAGATLLEQGSVATDSCIDNAYELAEVTGGANPLRSTDADDVETIVNTTLLFAGAIDPLYALVDVAYQTQSEIDADIVPDTEFEIPAVPGEDLRKVAVRIYGTSDAWEAIAKRNGIRNGSTIPEDLQTLIIPAALPDALDNRVGAC